MSAPIRTTPPADLGGTVAVITGAGRGIGRMLAASLAARGASVGLVARSADQLAATATVIEAAGGIVAAARADVTDADGLATAFAGLRERLGRVDVLVNNAGVLGPIGPLWELDPDDWWATMDVNVRGTVLASGLVLPEMVAAGHGRIVNITSVAGAHRWPLVSGYSVSKAAVIKLTENLAREARRHGVSVFSVHPGLLPIGMGETMAEHEPGSVHELAIRDWTMRQLAAGRGADPRAAIDLLVRVVAGDADRLSGEHISVHDDLDVRLRELDVRGRALERDRNAAVTAA